MAKRQTDGTYLLKVTLLANDSSDSTSRKTSSSTTDQLGKRSEELSFLERGFDTEEVGEDTDDTEKLVRRVTKEKK